MAALFNHGGAAWAANDAVTAKAAALVAKMTMAEKLGQLSNTAPAIPRLGIPAYNWWNEALHGAASGDEVTTNFPEPIGLAAAFDTGLLHSVAGAISQEVRANYGIELRSGELGQLGSGLDVWAPNINIFRDPRWGRGQETYGEDPFLTAQLAVAYITGMQGPDSQHPDVIATPKHFAVYSGPEPLRHKINVNVSLHDLEDTYLPAFRAAIVEAKAGSIMCSYNSVNGQPACANDFLMKTKLRGDWGFKGYVVSDCDAVTDIADTHHYAANDPAAVGDAFAAGLDNECSIDGIFGLSGVVANDKAAFASGVLTQVEIDRALVRLFAARYAVGALGGSPANAGNLPQLASAHQALALQSAEEGVVLLKNDGVLPLTQGRLKIALVGPLADQVRVLRGNYSSDLSPASVTLLDGLRAAMPKAEIDYVPAGAFSGDGDVVPTSALLTPDGKPGLQAQYFSAKPSASPPPVTMGDLLQHVLTTQYEAKPSVTRIEGGIDSTLNAAPGVPDQYQVVWSGFLVPPVSGTYQLGLKGLGQLIFNGRPLLTASDFMGQLGDLQTVQLTAGHRYPIVVASRKIGFLNVHLVWQRISTTPEADAIAAAKNADIVVAVVGLTSDLESEEASTSLPGFAGGDRTSLDLPAGEQALLEAAKSTGKPLVVVLMSGSAVNLAWAKANADAIVEAWYPGEEGGAAVANVLAGSYDPAGRLPVTFYQNVADLPPFSDYSMANRTYRYFTGTPIYPFGYGLSYTRFKYSALSTAQRGDGVVVRTTVRNTGKNAGDEVVELYLEFPDSPGVPKIALRGFTRIHLAPGEVLPVSFSLTPRDLSSVAPTGEHRVLQGRYRIIVGGGQPGTGAPASAAVLTVSRTLPVAG